MPEGALWPLVVYCGAVLALIALVLAVSSLLGERHRERATGEPFESGIVPVRPARLRLSPKFYLVAMLFVVFDLEAVFIISWAVIAREAGWAAYIEIAIFIAILIAALAYLWRVGALDWGSTGQRRPAPPGHWTRIAEHAPAAEPTSAAARSRPHASASPETPATSQ